MASWDLGQGESAVISFVLENPGFWAVIDDREARRCAMALHCRHTGTLGILVLAKRRGVIPSIREYIERLKEGGFKGRIECEGILIISTAAKVQAEVVCEDVYVAGEVRGNIIGKNVVELTQRGRIIGNIATANLVMEPGAFFKGKCNMDHQSDDQELLNHSPVTQPCTLADAQPTA